MFWVNLPCFDRVRTVCGQEMNKLDPQNNQRSHLCPNFNPSAAFGRNRRIITTDGKAVPRMKTVLDHPWDNSRSDLVPRQD
jgi:hypothetical protein